MNYVIGDIGNTNIKLCKVDKNFKIVKTFLFNTTDINLEKDFKLVIKKIVNNKTNKTILFSSVVPNVYEKISKIFKRNQFKVYEIKKFKLKKIMKFKLKKYSQLGSDRIANSIGAYHKFKTNCIIIDFGTATTFDVIKRNAIYDGGVIAPGIKLSIHNLFKSTALLPMFKLDKYPKNYGKNTKEALASGFFWGYEGLINNIIKKIIKKNKMNFKIILTGGYSYIFKNYLNKKTKIENDITMQGIIQIYKYFLI
tara:strand:- start:18355 stop:19113 length:759 start_codon:yes stop_codon:yes gene_type:complete